MTQEKDDLPLTIFCAVVVLSVVTMSWLPDYNLFRKRLFDGFMFWGIANVRNMEMIVSLLTVLLVFLLVGDFGFSRWSRWLSGLSALALAVVFSVLVFVLSHAGSVRPAAVAVFVVLVAPFVAWGFLRWFGRLRWLRVKQARGVNAPVRRAGLYLFGWFLDPLSQYINVGRWRRRLLPIAARRFAVRSRCPVLLPVDRLSMPSAVLGQPGTGKSRLLFSIYEQMAELFPSIPFLIHDPKGEWAARYYDPSTDLIFAPFCAGSCGWKIWEDFQTFPQIVNPVLQTGVGLYTEGGQEKFWGNKAVEYLDRATQEPTLDAGLAYLVTKSEEKKKDDTFKSIFANVTQTFTDIAAIEMLNAPHRLTMSEFLNHPGRVFLLNSPVASARQRGCFALFLSSFMLSALSRPDVSAGSLQCAALVDEALTLSLPADMERELYNKSRSKGIAVVNASPRLPVRREGESAAWGTQPEFLFAFRCEDMETRATLSARAGKVIFEERTTSESYQPAAAVPSGVTVSPHTQPYDELPPEFFGGLRPREFVLFHQGGICPGFTASVPDRRSVSPFEFVFDRRTDLNPIKDKLL
jgi:hypothetical protein